MVSPEPSGTGQPLWGLHWGFCLTPIASTGSQSARWEQQPSASAARGCEQTSLPTTTSNSRESTQGRMWPVDGTGLPSALSQG